MNSNYKGMRAGFATVTTLFFMWGFITVSIDPLIAALKAIFELTYAAVVAHAVRVLHGVLRRVAARRGADRAARQQQVDHVRARRHGGRLPHRAGRDALRHLLAGARGAVRHRERHHHPAGGGESAGRGAGPAGTLAFPPDVLADLQLFRHLARAECSSRASSSRVASSRSLTARRSRPSCAPNRSAVSTCVFLAIAGALVLLALFIFAFRKLLDVTKPVDEGQRPSIATAFKSRWALFGGARDLPVRRRRGVDRQSPDQLPARTGHAEHSARRSRQDGQLTTGAAPWSADSSAAACCSS